MANLELKTASGGSVTLVPEDGGGNFSVNIKNADGTLLLSEDFDQKSLTTNGYQVLPSGLIIQWGVSSAATTTNVLVTFPIAFPNSVLRILENDFGSGIEKTIWAVDSVTVTGLRANNLGRVSAGMTTFNPPAASSYLWLAIGY